MLSAQGRVPLRTGQKQVRKEYEAYKEKMTRQHTQFKILEESVQPDGSIIVKLKKQNNQQAIGDYFNDWELLWVSPAKEIT